jgi:hypothetical protein
MDFDCVERVHAFFDDTKALSAPIQPSLDAPWRPSTDRNAKRLDHLSTLNIGRAIHRELAYTSFGLW